METKVMSVWKKALIVALCVIATGVVIVLGISATAYCRYRIHSNYSPQPRHVSPFIRIEYFYNRNQSYVRLKDVQTGEFTTPKLRYVYANEYSKDSIVVFRDMKQRRGYLNTHTGRIVIPAKYDRAWNFSEGIGAVFNDGMVSFLKADGLPAFEKAFPIIYDDSSREIGFQFHNGLCVMPTLDNKWGLIDTQGEWVVEPVYNSIDAPYHGYRRVYDGMHYGLVNQDGSTALALVYDDIRRASDGKGWILVKDGLASETDFLLNVTIPFVHDGIHTLGYIDSYDIDEYYDEASGEYKTRKQNQPRFFRYDIGDKSGVIDANGKVIIPAIFYNVCIVNDHLFQVEVTGSGERMLYDTNGRYVGK